MQKAAEDAARNNTNALEAMQLELEKFQTAVLAIVDSQEVWLDWLEPASVLANAVGPIGGRLVFGIGVLLGWHRRIRPL